MKSVLTRWEPLAMALNSTPSRSMSLGRHHSSMLPVSHADDRNRRVYSYSGAKRDVEVVVSSGWADRAWQVQTDRESDLASWLRSVTCVSQTNFCRNMSWSVNKLFFFFFYIFFHHKLQNVLMDFYVIDNKKQPLFVKWKNTTHFFKKIKTKKNVWKVWCTFFPAPFTLILKFKSTASNRTTVRLYFNP